MSGGEMTYACNYVPKYQNILQLLHFGFFLFSLFSHLFLCLPFFFLIILHFSSPSFLPFLLLLHLRVIFSTSQSHNHHNSPTLTQPPRTTTGNYLRRATSSNRDVFPPWQNEKAIGIHIFTQTHSKKEYIHTYIYIPHKIVNRPPPTQIQV